MSQAWVKNIYVCMDCSIRRIFGLWGASGGAKFPQMGDSLPRTPVNHCAKFDAASFIVAGEIHNHTNTHTHKW